MIRILLLITALVKSTDLWSSGRSLMSHEYTVCVDNSSLIEILPDFQSSTVSIGTKGSNKYTSFVPGCYTKKSVLKPNRTFGSEGRSPKIRVRVFPSFPLLRQVGGKKKLINHVNQLFAESNKIFMNQLSIRLVPEIIIPKSTDSAPINGGINVIGDLNTFGTYIRGRPRVPVNIFIASNYQGIVGAAYVGTLGSTNFNYAVSVNKDSVISHEILHVFGAQHTFGKGGVMDYSNRLINGVLQMHIDNRAQVCPTIDYFFKNYKP